MGFFINTFPKSALKVKVGLALVLVSLTTCPLTDFIVEDTSTLVLWALVFVGKVADTDSAIMVPLARALVFLTDFVVEDIGALVVFIRNGFLIAEPVHPAACAIPVSTA